MSLPNQGYEYLKLIIQSLVFVSLSSVCFLELGIGQCDEQIEGLFHLNRAGDHDSGVDIINCDHVKDVGFFITVETYKKNIIESVLINRKQ